MHMFAPARAAAGEDIRRARALHIHRFLFRLALGAGNIFAWVFVFRGFFLGTGDLEATLAGVVILYALSQSIAFVLTPLTGAALRHGIRRALVYGTLSSAFAFACMTLVFAPQASNGFAFWMIGSFVILSGIHRAMYWIPYKTEAADIHSLRTPFVLAREAAIALMPLLAGFSIEAASLGPVFLLAAVSGLIVLSLFPLASLPESYERFEWDYPETFSRLFSPFNRGPLQLAILDGIQGATLLLIWPLAAFVILGQSFAALGVILSATLCIGFIGRSIVRRTLRHIKADRSTPVMAAIAFSSWIFRLSAGSPIQIFVADAYYHAGNSARRFSIDAFTFDQSADGGHFIDEYTALKEMGMALGRILACALLVVLALSMNAALAFAAAIIVAAISAASSVFISRRLARGV